MVSRVNIVGYDCGVEYDPDGYYVRYSDYATLEAQLAETTKELSLVRAERDRAQKACEQIAARLALEGGE